MKTSEEQAKKYMRIKTKIEKGIFKIEDIINGLEWYEVNDVKCWTISEYIKEKNKN